jgi:hypothetical protein
MGSPVEKMLQKIHDEKRCGEHCWLCQDEREQALRSALAEAVGLLRLNQFQDLDPDDEPRGYCAFCNGALRQHEDNCRLAAFLEKHG